MNLLWLKYFHITCATLSFCGFALRGWWRLRDPARLRRRWVRTMPHLVDSGLFFSGLAMVWLYRWSPLDHHWLAAKLTALLLYIGLGALALRRGRARWVLAALAVFCYIVAVALSKRPLPWLA